jgi:nicotinamidase-related amidase
VDGDGDTDLLFASLWGDESYEAESYVYWNDGGTFDEADHCALPTMGAHTIYAEDLDQDGVSEVLVPSSWDDDTANETWSHIFWTVTPDHCEGGETQLPTLAPLEMSIGDLDGDGHPDLAFASSSYVSYATETLIYWGSADGYDETAVTGIAADHGVSSAPFMIGL